ncbi:[NiFe] hydrogenase assembly HybE family chaperone [Rhodoblastus acidophilus]|uniref:[NiFe]-hydrogenase assembly chaperone HybE n=1 Tax=Rhodoblastus acidophilus TaxID=1074 RepID=UPI002224DC03|nr:[NiFe]-hydrogenase assembly chaperone HybE [Rhodoblastus acidophilus]MCW2283063.1 [NiFe] hydrogenase assembly HybE family chaperone [Rhodoblastus acidophilus]MCW2331886.1 [NiFe] hydrogenase assembly HybE family chaperone [Rhodoblastus acidophilus]
MRDDLEAAELAARLEEHFEELYERCMKDMPICNPHLRVACIGFRPYGDFNLGIVLTPWFMNVCASPRAGAPKVEDRPGATRGLALPTGNVDFLATDLDGFDRLLFASLFSPMDDFADHAAAQATAEAAMDALMKPPEPASPPSPPPKKEPVALDRRAFFRLGRRA